MRLFMVKVDRRIGRRNPELSLDIPSHSGVHNFEGEKNFKGSVNAKDKDKYTDNYKDTAKEKLEGEGGAYGAYGADGVDDADGRKGNAGNEAVIMEGTDKVEDLGSGPMNVLGGGSERAISPKGIKIDFNGGIQS